MPETRTPMLTPAMRRMLVIVAAIVVAGLAVTLWIVSQNVITKIADPSPSASPGQGSTVPTPGADPNATPTTGSEVLPPSSQSPDAGLPPLEPSTPLVTEPLPPSASLQGGLVAGFPTSVIGPMPGAEVVESSVASEGTTMQATLIARTDASPEEVAAHYQASWKALGLSGSSQGRENAIMLSYAGPYESLSLAFTAGSGTGTVYMVYGVFRTS